MDFGKTLNKVFLEILDHPQNLFFINKILTKENVLFGIGKKMLQNAWFSVAKENGGRGTRNNNAKRQYCWENIENLEIKLCILILEEAKAVEDVLRQQKNHIFNT